jgi:hypothetical protein
MVSVEPLWNLVSPSARQLVRVGTTSGSSTRQGAAYAPGKDVSQMNA